MCVKMVDEGWLRLERQATLDSGRRSPWFRGTTQLVWQSQGANLARALERCNRWLFALRIVKELSKDVERGAIDIAQYKNIAEQIMAWAGKYDELG